MLGDGYIAQHVQQQIQQENRERRYRQYVTDALYVLARGRLSLRWVDMDPGLEPCQRIKSAQEVTSGLLSVINEGRDPV